MGVASQSTSSTLKSTWIGATAEDAASNGSMRLPLKPRLLTSMVSPTTMASARWPAVGDQPGSLRL
jgi:hypothetical protein